jgi:hypothetical protein
MVEHEWGPVSRTGHKILIGAMFVPHPLLLLALLAFWRSWIANFGAIGCQIGRLYPAKCLAFKGDNRQKRRQVA